MDATQAVSPTLKTSNTKLLENNMVGSSGTGAALLSASAEEDTLQLTGTRTTLGCPQDKATTMATHGYSMPGYYTVPRQDKRCNNRFSGSGHGSYHSPGNLPTLLGSAGGAHPNSLLYFRHLRCPTQQFIYGATPAPYQHNFPSQSFSYGHPSGVRQFISGEQPPASCISTRAVSGEEHVIGYNTIAGEDRVISERVIEHEVKVPKKIVREEVIEKVRQ